MDKLNKITNYYFIPKLQVEFLSITWKDRTAVL